MAKHSNQFAMFWCIIMWGSTLTFIKKKEKKLKIKEKPTKGNNQLKEIKMGKELAKRNYRSECDLAMKFCKWMTATANMRKMLLVAQQICSKQYLVYLCP